MEKEKNVYYGNLKFIEKYLNGKEYNILINFIA